MRSGDKLVSLLAFAIAFFVVPSLVSAAPVGTGFTYQGRLQSSGRPFEGPADLQFRLFNQELAGDQVGGTIILNDQVVVDGLFTVELDFGAAAFNGQALWLQITVEGTTLSPRQKLTDAPFALYSLAPWATSGTSIFYNAGAVGIGTSSPNYDLDIEKANATLRLFSTSAGGTSSLDLQGDTPSGIGANVLGSVRFLDSAGSVNAQISSSEGLLANALNFSVEGSTEMVLTDGGNLGVGTTLPLTRLQVVGGTDIEPASGGFAVFGDTAALNIGIDNNEIMARDDGAVSTLYLNNDGGDVSIVPNGGGQVGVGMEPFFGATLSVFNSLFVTGGAQPRLDIGSNGFILMGDNADITITNGGLEVNTPSGGSTFFNRTNPDGTLISFLNDGASAGGIAVAGNTVIYTTFTGDHNAWTDQPIAGGSLVRLTGENRRGRTGPNSEPTYGIELTTSANDPTCMGSYLSAPDESNPESQHLVASVGNGEMWVVDDGRGNIQAGDYLISSDVPGAAMKDDVARFAVGHVIARAAESIDWSAIKVVGSSPRRALVSVFYESFDRQGDPAEMDLLKKTVEAQRLEIEMLQARLSDLETIAGRLASLEAVLSNSSSGDSQLKKERAR